MYDAIGNRTSYTLDATPTYYCTNNLNQYEHTAGASNCPAPTTESFTYDADGNLTADGTYTYTWDAENRLIRVEPVTPVDDVSRKLEFAYDYMGRRAQKKVYSRTAGGWDLASDLRFVYDQWNVVMVVNASGTPQQKYTWGLDLSGLGGLRGESGSAGIHGAGGIGGLLAVGETAAEGSPSYWFFYDGNGNVGQVIRASDQGIPARYEYDPYGNTLVAEGAYAAANPLRFSTKWCDTEPGTGHELYYYGYRYYSPRLGRWLSRDPIGEAGGLNLLGYVGNAPVVSQDSLGLWDCVKGICEPPTPPPPPPPPSPPQSRTSPSGCPWPAFPSDPPGASPGTRCLDLPAGEDMWNPWLRWFVERHEGENVLVCPTSRWGRRVLGLDTTAKLEHDADAAISSLLGADCKCQGNANAVGSQAAFVQTKDFDRTTLLDDPFAFLSIGGLHLHASATCNVNHCCRSCSASCRVYYEVFDSWHFDLNPYNSGGLQSFWWTIRYSKNRQFDVKCTRH